MRHKNFADNPDVDYRFGTSPSWTEGGTQPYLKRSQNDWYMAVGDCSKAYPPPRLRRATKDAYRDCVSKELKLQQEEAEASVKLQQAGQDILLSPDDQKGLSTGAVIGMSVAAAAILGTVAIIIIRIRRRRK